MIKNRLFQATKPCQDQLLLNNAINFTDGILVNKQVSDDEVFYKYHGEDNRPRRFHSYVSNKPYTSEADLRNDLAILVEWGIENDRVTTFRPLKGTWISEGTAAKQIGDFTDEFRPGGGYQGSIDINSLPKLSRPLSGRP